MIWSISGQINSSDMAMPSLDSGLDPREVEFLFPEDIGSKDWIKRQRITIGKAFADLVFNPGYKPDESPFRYTRAPNLSNRRELRQVLEEAERESKATTTDDFNWLINKGTEPTLSNVWDIGTLVSMVLNYSSSLSMVSNGPILHRKALTSQRYTFYHHLVSYEPRPTLSTTN